MQSRWNTKLNFLIWYIYTYIKQKIYKKTSSSSSADSTCRSLTNGRNERYFSFYFVLKGKKQKHSPSLVVVVAHFTRCVYEALIIHIQILFKEVKKNHKTIVPQNRFQLDILPRKHSFFIVYIWRKYAKFMTWDNKKALKLFFRWLYVIRHIHTHTDSTYVIKKEW